MEKGDRQRRIERFLNGELSDLERKAFLQEMEENTDLAEEVSLTRLMHDELGNSAKTAFIKELNELSDEFFGSPPEAASPPKRSNGRRYLVVVALLAIVAGLAWSLWPEPETPVDPQETQPLPQTESTLPEEQESPDSPMEKNGTPIPEERKEKAPDKTVQRPIAAVDPADFQPHPYLEDLIGQQVRSEAISIEAGAKLIGRDQLLINGTIATADPEDVPNYVIVVYSNRGEDYVNGDYLERLPLRLEPSAGTKDERSITGQAIREFTFSLSRSVDWSPGWYYYFIATARDEEPLWVGKIIKDR